MACADRRYIAEGPGPLRKPGSRRGGIDKSYRGTCNVRVPPEPHRQAARQAALKGISLNQLVQDALEAALNA